MGIREEMFSKKWKKNNVSVVEASAELFSCCFWVAHVIVRQVYLHFGKEIPGVQGWLTIGLSFDAS